MPYADINNARKVAQQMGNLTENLTYQGMEDGAVFTLDNRLTFAVSLHLVSAAKATEDVLVRIRDRLMQAVQGSLPVGAVVRAYLETHPCTRTALDVHAPIQRDDSPLQGMLSANHQLLERLRSTRWISETQAYLTITLPIPGRAKATAFQSGAQRPWVEKAKMLQSRLVRQLTLGGMQATPMSQEEVWNRIMDYWNPSMVSAEKPPYQAQFSAPDLAAVRLLRRLKNNAKATRPHVPSMRAQVACSDIDLDYDNCFMVGHTRVGIVSFLSPTGTTRFNASHEIVQALGGTHSTFMVEYVVVDVAKVRADVNDSLDKQETAASDPTMKVGREVHTRVADGMELVQQLEMGQVLTQMSMHAIIYAREQDELDSRRERVLAAFSSVGGCMPRIATSANAVVLFLENAPFSGKQSSYQVGAYYQNAADCIPKIGPWAGSPGGVLPLRGRNGNVFSFTPLGMKNAGVVVAGSSGGGKSVFISQLAAGLIHAHDASLTVLDPKRDYVALFMLLGAMDAVVSIAPHARLPNGERVCLNPFDLPPDEWQPSGDKYEFLMELMRALNINDLSSARVSVLNQAIKNFYQRFSRRKVVDGQEVDAYAGEGTLTDFADLISRLNTVADRSVQSDVRLREAVSDIANELRSYCGRTPLGTLLDGQTTINIRSRYLYLDIKGMLENPGSLLAKVGMLITKELTWTRSMALSGYKVIVQEEAGVALEVPGLVAQTTRMFKTGRSLGVIPILSFQDVSDALAYKGIVNNANNRVLLASNASERSQLADVFGLNDSMRRLYASLDGSDDRFREALILQGNGDQLNGDVGQLWLSREAYWLSTSTKEEADLRAQVALDLFDGDEARAAMHLAREERHAA
ncbi:VirB4 family type IV secretion system protein [Deinococcus ruber]|uniref:TraG P-loop domain-containing protein n=1 Tax=Deinococcus ruber TaxID=1848197 RepID=A0A918C9Q3_9DEIO|nr:DUF87 domain-containing protein [Deinococcus ruber]GGR12870.1 hypothetical protein GCM10008957_27280 [Deinococcus ruber]